MALMSANFGGAFGRIGLIGERFVSVFDAQSHELGDEQLLKPTALSPTENPGVAVVASAPTLTVALRDQFIGNREMLRNPFYNEFMRPFDMWHVAIVNVLRDKKHM